MKSFEVKRDRINTDALNSAIRASLGDVYTGLSSKPGMVTLYFGDEASGTEMEAARDIAILHDPVVLSPRQEAENARRGVLASVREANADSLDSSQYDSEAPLMRQLAQKIIWLEEEIRDLRDL